MRRWNAMQIKKFNNEITYLDQLKHRRDSKQTPDYFAQLLDLLEQSKISSRVAKDILKEVVFESKNPLDIVTERGLLQDSSADSLKHLIETIVSENPAVVTEYKAGKEASIQFLVGQGMKATKGSTNPSVLLQMLIDRLKI